MGKDGTGCGILNLKNRERNVQYGYNRWNDSNNDNLEWPIVDNEILVSERYFLS